MSSVSAFPFGPHEKSYNDVASALEEYATAVSTPVVVPGVADRPGMTLPYDQRAVTDAVRRVARQVTQLDETWGPYAGPSTPSPWTPFVSRLKWDQIGSTVRVFSPDTGRLAREVLALTQAESVERQYFHGPSGTVTPLVSDLMARVASELAASPELSAARVAFAASAERSQTRFADPFGEALAPASVPAPAAPSVTERMRVLVRSFRGRPPYQGDNSRGA